MNQETTTILILGAGINGAAIARELALNGLGVVVVDAGDIASGATAYSSRLIHGGLRYLEYGEFSLVRESLDERTRLLRLAPQFVRPLRLFVPVGSRWGGLRSAPGRFLGRPARRGAATPRGLWLVRLGLTLYDQLARGSELPARGVHHTAAGDAPPFDPANHPWACSYWDAQIVYPERFTLALLEDARRLAESHGAEFRLFTYHRTELSGRKAAIRPTGQRPDSGPTGEVEREFQPAAVINATGAWVDRTLQQLHIPTARLMGGTKGSHLLTHHAGLREALNGRGVYAEAEDGRPVFLLPFGEGTLIGTTDLPFDEPPETAIASEAEIKYLLAAAKEVFPHLELTREDVTLHYSGVRPLPYVDATTPAAITRRHFLKEHPDAAIPLYSVIGGKLTTCRSLAEETAAAVLARFGRTPTANSRERVIPGGELQAAGQAAREAKQLLAERLGYSLAQVEAVWALCGTLSESALAGMDLPPQPDDRDNLPQTTIPLRFVRHSLRREWPRRLSDLVERRLLLQFHEPLTEDCLRTLARLMVEAGLLSQDRMEDEIEACRRRLAEHFGKRVQTGSV